jgi:phytoene desaturase
MGKKAAVIGSGIAGLSAAIDLRSKGFDVDLYEKNDHTGGKAGFQEHAGFKFDTGPSLLTMPFVFERLLNKLNKRLEDTIPIEKLDIICKYFFSDGTVLNAFSDRQRLLQEFDEKTCDNNQDIRGYFDYCRKMYENSKDLFLFNSLIDAPDFFKKEPLKGLKTILILDIFRNLHLSHKRFFRDKNNVQLFDRYATYSGSNPYKLPATFNIIPHVEYEIGAYVPKKGIRAIPMSLTQAAVDSGVNIFLNSMVDKINYKGRKITGINARQTERDYDIVISNSDVNYTYQNLLKDRSTKTALRYRKLEPSSSAIVFYWGIKGEFSELQANNIFFSSDYKKEFDQIFKQGICPDEPTVYINITSKYCPSDAPGGCENWFVLVNVPYDKGQNWQKQADIMRSRILLILEKYLGRKIEPLICTEKVMTPKDIYDKTLSNKGSIYGISSNSKLAAFHRQPNKSEEYDGLYFAGGSAHPGGGMPLVALSGMIASDLAQRYEV